MMEMSKRYHSGAYFEKKPAILIESGAIFRKSTKKSQQEKNIRPRGATQRGPCVPKGPKYGTIDTNYDERDSRLMFF